jgi:2,3-dihydroxybiphenyl 1,2-dioxygenase
MTITQLGYLGLGVGDIAEWEEFASEVLGMMVSKSSDGSTTYLRMDDYHHRFILHPDAADDVAYLGWQAPTKSAFDDVHSNLKDAGVTVRAATSEELASRKVMDMIAFEDPDGARTEVFHGALVQPDTAFRSPRPIKGFVTGSMGLGHIVLNVNDLEKATAFYRDVLGLRISDFVEINRPDRQLKMSFFHCNPRHHSLALAGRAAGAQGPRISHFMIEVQSLDDVGATYYLCQERNIPIATSLGRHTNDHMVSFYMLCPSGFRVEYGCEGRMVDDSTWTIQHYTTGSLWGHKPVPQSQGNVAAPANR